MKRLYLFFLMFLMQVNLYAQEIEWAKKISIPFWNPHGMLYDNSGNVYLYGSYYRNWNINDPGQVINDTVGSFIQKYSDEGELIFEKRWKLPFYIVKMIFDGDNAFYFTGCFAGSLNLNGVAFNSMGEYDGMVGKMDLNGNIYWVSTFGGGKSDFGMGISMYANSTNLLITGSVADSLFVNSQYKGSEPLPMFLGIFNLNGHNIKNKLVDFIPERIHSNRGIEITCDKNNEIFVLGDREGAHWYGDTIDGPLAGRYIIKFNENLDTLWSRYLIGPSCYNGWSNGNLVADSKGDIYTRSYCSFKYGGDGSISRLSNSNASTLWTGQNRDGGYSDIFFRNNSIWFVGKEGANGCPCPGSNSGYQVIKKMDENNQLLGEARIMGVWLRKIIQDNQGNVFVYGAFNERQAHIGKDVILADSISSSGTSFYYSGHFLIKLNDKNCTPPSINDVPHHPFNRIICPDQVFQLDAGPGFVDYEWSNGSKTQKIEVSEPNRYTVKVKDKNNCISYSSPISILHKENSSVHNLCLITYENDKQIIYGTLNFDYSTKNYKIYKIDKATGDTVDVLFEDYKNYLNVQFVDENSTPSTKAYLYSISKVDTCGLESPVSVAHKPILLKIRKEGTSNLLEWEPYEGMDIHSYHIYKGTDKGKMRLVDSIGVSVLIYVDTNLDSLFHYQVKANKKLFCYLGSSNYFGTTSSNIVVDEAYVPTIVEATEMDINADLFPNPAHDILTIQLPEQKQVTIVLKNLLGEVLYKTSGNQNKFEIPMQNFKQGLYVISIDYGVERKQFKIIKH